MDKKQKQMIGIGAAILVVVILIIAFSGKEYPRVNMNENALTTEEKYAMFEAEVACKLMEKIKDVEDPQAFIQGTLEVIDEVNAKYGYTLQEMEQNKVLFQNNVDFQNMARDYALEICPEIASELTMGN